MNKGCMENRNRKTGRKRIQVAGRDVRQYKIGDEGFCKALLTVN